MLQQGLILVQHLGQQHGEVLHQALVDGMCAYHVEPAVLLVIHLQVETHHGLEIAGPPFASRDIDGHGIVLEAGEADVIDVLVGGRPLQQFLQGAPAQRCRMQFLGGGIEEGEGVVGLLQLGGLLLYLALQFPIELAEFCGHGGKGPRQFSQFVLTVGGQGEIEFLALDLAGAQHQLIERRYHLLAGKADCAPGDGDDGEQAKPLGQGQHAHLELDVVLHLVDEIIDGSDELLGIVGITAGSGVLDVLAHHLPLQQHLAIGAAQGGGGDPALGLLQFGGVEGLLELGEPPQDGLVLLDFVGHPVGLHAQ